MEYTKRMRLTVIYKTGAKVQNLVNYLHFEEGRLCFTVDKQVQNVIEDQVCIPVENIARYDLEWVYCTGWKTVVEE